MAKSIEAIEGIGEKYGKKLRNAGCVSPAALLRDGGSRKGRKILRIAHSIILVGI